MKHIYLLNPKFNNDGLRGFSFGADIWIATNTIIAMFLEQMIDIKQNQLQSVTRKRPVRKELPAF